MKKVMKLVCCLFVLSLMAAPLHALELKLGHVVNEKDVFHAAAEKLKEVAEKNPKADLKITLFPNAKLGDERNLLESLKMGSVDMAIITGGPVINFLPKFGVLDLPFLFTSPEQAYRVLDGKIGQGFFKDMEALGWKGLAYGERGFRNVTNSKRPVKTPADLKGLKIRVMQNPVYVDAFKAMGANAVPMAWMETLTALQQKTIDGQENPINVIEAFNIAESNKHMTLTRHSYSPNLILMSMRTWKKLNPEQQKVIMNASKVAAKYNRDLDAKMEKEWLAELKKQGMQIVEKPDIKAFREAVKPVYEKYEPQFGKDLIQAILNTK